MKNVKAVLQYVVLLAIAGVLIWFSLRGLVVGEGENKFDFLWNTYRQADQFWLWAMAAVALVSHIIRAERWRMLLAPSGNHIGLANSFLSLMIGYLVNLVVPRGGEVSRCYNLYKLEKTPVEISFGTVVVERIIDVICLLALIGLAFVIEWDKLMGFLDTLPIGKTGAAIPSWVYVAVVGAAGLAVLIYLFRKNEKLQKLWAGFKEGLISVFKLRQKALFITYSVLIWVLYFITSYCVIKAFPQTAELGFSAVLTLFALGSIAMAVPLPGGTGSYHTIVPLGLTALYHLPKADAIAFVFIFHAWQTLLMIVAGVICLLISYWIIRWKTPQPK